MIVADARRVVELIREIQALEMQIDKIALQASIAQRIRSIDGFGPICSSTLAGELGNIDRFASESSLVLYCGMTRRNNDSGLSTGSKNTRQVNTHRSTTHRVEHDVSRQFEKMRLALDQNAFELALEQVADTSVRGRSFFSQNILV
jgi:transposase